MAKIDKKIDNVYCEDVLSSCRTYKNYKCTFEEIVQKDSGDKDFGCDKKRSLKMQSFDVDEIERNTGKSGNKNCTMDLVIGIASFDCTKRKFSNRRLLPVELKLNCKSFNPKIIGDLKNKDEHTRAMEWNGVPFSSKSIFLFPSGIIDIANRFVASKQRGSGGSDIRNWILFDPNGFNDYIHFVESCPYYPETDFSSIENTINEFITEGNIWGCTRYLEESVRPRLEVFQKRYKIEEIKYVVECLRKTMDAIYPKLPQSDEAEFLKSRSDEILDFYEKFIAKSNS